MKPVWVSAPGSFYERFIAAYLRGFLRVAFRPLIGPPWGVKAQRRVVNLLSWCMPGSSGTFSYSLMSRGVSIQVTAPVEGDAGGVILYLHGGAFCLGSAHSHRSISTRLAAAAGLPVWLPAYRLAPEHPYPAALDDAMATYLGLLDVGYAPERIVLAGDSAGGALALALALRLREDGYAAPAALALMSPVTDPSLSGPSIREQAGADPMVRQDWLEQGLGWYAAPTHTPSCTPLEQHLGDLPPMFIQVGEREILLSDSIRLAEHAQACGVPCQLEIHAGRWHVFQLQAAYLPSIRLAVQTFARFARESATRFPSSTHDRPPQ